MIFTKEWVLERVRVYDNGQLFFSGKPITSVKNETEKDRVIDDLCIAMNKPYSVGCDNIVDAIDSVRERHHNRKILKQSPYEQNKLRIEESKGLFYKTSHTSCGLSFINSFNDIFLKITANRLLDICSDLVNGRDESYINQQYVESLDDDFGLVVYAWQLGKLNNSINHICSRSKKPGGYTDHFSGETIRNRQAKDYLKDLRGE